MAASHTQTRLTTLDALRGISVFAMIEQHLGVWLWAGPAPGRTLTDYPGLIAFNVALVIGAPMFFTLSGVGAGFMSGNPGSGETTAHHERGHRDLDRRLFLRGLGLWTFGQLVNLATPSWFSWGSFFALQLMGVALATAPLWRRMGSRALLATAWAILLATPLCQVALDIPLRLSNDQMGDVTLPGGALRLALCGSQYSLVPWLSTYLFGFWAARHIAARRLGPLWGVGGLLLALGTLGHLGFLLSGPDEASIFGRAFEIHLGWFPPSVAVVSVLAGPTLGLIALATKREWKRPMATDHPAALLGRLSLTVFIVHAPLFRELSRPLGLWEGLSAGATLLAIGLFTLACIGLARWWARRDFRCSAEWLLRRLAG